MTVNVPTAIEDLHSGDIIQPWESRSAATFRVTSEPYRLVPTRTLWAVDTETMEGRPVGYYTKPLGTFVSVVRNQ